jgi:hypothetical protein
MRGHHLLTQDLIKHPVWQSQEQKITRCNEPQVKGHHLCKTRTSGTAGGETWSRFQPFCLKPQNNIGRTENEGPPVF